MPGCAGCKYIWIVEELIKRNPEIKHAIDMDDRFAIEHYLDTMGE